MVENSLIESLEWFTEKTLDDVIWLQPSPTPYQHLASFSHVLKAWMLSCEKQWQMCCHTQVTAMFSCWHICLPFPPYTWTYTNERGKPTYKFFYKYSFILTSPLWMTLKIALGNASHTLGNLFPWGCLSQSRSVVRAVFLGCFPLILFLFFPFLIPAEILMEQILIARLSRSQTIISLLIQHIQ